MLVPFGSHAREPAAWEPPLLEILDLLSMIAKGGASGSDDEDFSH